MGIAKKKAEEPKHSYDVEVKRVKELESGDIAFDMLVNGITIYGCIYKEGEKDGNEYAFVSFPSRKGSDGKYYSHVYFRIEDDLLKDIQSQIESLL